MEGTLNGHHGPHVLVHVEAPQWHPDTAITLCQNVVETTVHKLALREEQGSVMRLIVLVCLD